MKHAAIASGIPSEFANIMPGLCMAVASNDIDSGCVKRLELSLHETDDFDDALAGVFNI